MRYESKKTFLNIDRRETYLDTLAIRTQLFLGNTHFGSSKMLAVADMGALLQTQSDLITGIQAVFPFDDGVPRASDADALALRTALSEIYAVTRTIQRRRTSIPEYEAYETKTRRLVRSAFSDLTRIDTQDYFNPFDIGSTLDKAVKTKMDLFDPEIYPTNIPVRVTLHDLREALSRYVVGTDRHAPERLAIADNAETIIVENIGEQCGFKYIPLTTEKATKISATAQTTAALRERIREHELTVQGYRTAKLYIMGMADRTQNSREQRYYPLRESIASTLKEVLA